MTSNVCGGRLIFPVFACAVTFSLAACGGSTPPTESTASAVASSEPAEDATPEQEPEGTEGRTVTSGELAVGDCFREDENAVGEPEYPTVACDAPHDGEVFCTPASGECVDFKPHLADYVGVAQGDVTQWLNDGGFMVSLIPVHIDGGQYFTTALASADEDAQLTQSYRSSG